jgi:dienelactone hydrolase
MTFRPRTVFAAVVALVVSSATAPAQAPAPERASFFLIAGGKDTIASERFTLTATRMDGELLVKPAASRMTWSLGLTPDFAATRLLLAGRGAADAANAPPRQKVDVTFEGDSATMVTTVGTAVPTTRRVAFQPGAVPFANPSFAMLEVALRHLAARGWRDTIAPVFVASGTSISMPVRRVGADSAVLMLGQVEMRLRIDDRGRIHGAAIPAQRIVVTRGAWLDDVAMALPKPDYSAPAGAPYTAEDVVIPTARGYTLAGTLTLPAAAKGPVPAVVTITGSGPEDRDEGIPALGDYRPFRWIADTLARRGIATLRVDDRGTGASGGDFASATSADFADDIRSILAYLRTRREVDARRLGLVGHSEGGLIAPMVAATDRSLKGIVLMAGPSQTGRTILNFQLRNSITGNATFSAAERDSALARVPARLDSLLVSTPWLRFFGDYDPKATARKVRDVPVLILQGATDQQVTPGQSAELAAAFRAGGNRRVKEQIFPGTNHLFVADSSGFPGGYTRLPSLALRPEVLGAVADWLVLTMGIPVVP